MRAVASGQRQRGALLLLTLMLLTALGALGLAAASDRVLQQRIANNHQSLRQAQLAAHAAQQWAEHWLLGLDGQTPPAACSENCAPRTPIYVRGALGVPMATQTVSWWQAEGHPAGNDPLTGTQTSLASIYAGSGWWLVEEMYRAPGPFDDARLTDLIWYRIVALGTDSHDQRVAVHESMLARPYGDAILADALPRGSTSTFCRTELPNTACGRRAWQVLR